MSASRFKHSGRVGKLEKEIADAKRQMMSEVMLMIMHDIASPLYNIRNSCRMIEFHIDRSQTEKADLLKYVADILQSADSCIQKIETARSLQISARQPKRKSMYFSEIANGIKGLINLLPRQLARGIEFRADATTHAIDVKAEVNETLLSHCMLNLLINASTFSEPDYPVRVDCKLLAEELVFSVSNAFAGNADTSPDEWKAIGYTTKGMATGHGLSVVNSICVSEGYHLSLDYRHSGRRQVGEVVATIRIESTPND